MKKKNKGIAVLMLINVMWRGARNPESRTWEAAGTFGREMGEGGGGN